MLAQTRWLAVYEAYQVNRGPGPFVIKTTRPGLAERDRLLAHGLLQREAEIGLSLSHRHLVPTLELLDREESWLLQPSYPEASLAASLTAWPLAARLWVVRQTAEALVALHRGGWLHGNVTSSSIVVLPSGHATLLELGWSRQLASEECDLAATNFAGHIRYAAPEMFDTVGRLTPAADVYSLGVILYQVLTGHPLWRQYSGPELIAAKRTLAPPDLSSANVPYSIATLTRTMLHRDPLRRPTLQAVIEALVAAEIEALSPVSGELRSR